MLPHNIFSSCKVTIDEFSECDGELQETRVSPPDSFLLRLLQVGVPLQHRHDLPLLLLRQVAQVDHGSASCFVHRQDVETLGSGNHPPDVSVATVKHTHQVNNRSVAIGDQSLTKSSMLPLNVCFLLSFSFASTLNDVVLFCIIFLYILWSVWFSL